MYYNATRGNWHRTANDPLSVVAQIEIVKGNAIGSIKTGDCPNVFFMPAYAARAIKRAGYSMADYFKKVWLPNAAKGEFYDQISPDDVFSGAQLQMLRDTSSIVHELLSSFCRNPDITRSTCSVRYNKQTVAAIQSAAEDSALAIVAANVLEKKSRSIEDVDAIQLEEKMCRVHAIDSNDVVVVLSASFFKSIAWGALLDPEVSPLLGSAFPTSNTNLELSAILYSVTKELFTAVLERNNYETTIVSYLFGLHQRLVINLSKYQ